LHLSNITHATTEVSNALALVITKLVPVVFAVTQTAVGVETVPSD
jgi:hypothetical protein